MSYYIVTLYRLQDVNTFQGRLVAHRLPFKVARMNPGREDTQFRVSKVDNMSELISGLSAEANLYGAYKHSRAMPKKKVAKQESSTVL